MWSSAHRAIAIRNGLAEYTGEHRFREVLLKMDRFSEMEAFVEVVRGGGFTAAAKKLGRSKSLVSKQVSSLEARLGIKLLSRTTRKVSATILGEAYCLAARRVLDEVSKADSLVSAMHSTPKGLLRISVPEDFYGACVGTMVVEFLKQFPEVTINVRFADGPASENVDVEIRLGQQEGSVLSVYKLCETTMLLVASEEYLSSGGKITTVDDLKDHQLLYSSMNLGPDVWELMVPSGELRAVRTTGRLIVPDSNALLQAAINGLGIAQLPDYLCVEALKKDLVKVVAPFVKKRSRSFYVVHQNNHVTPPNVRAFTEFLVQQFACLSEVGS